MNVLTQQFDKRASTVAAQRFSETFDRWPLSKECKNVQTRSEICVTADNSVSQYQSHEQRDVPSSIAERAMVVVLVNL